MEGVFFPGYEPPGYFSTRPGLANRVWMVEDIVAKMDPETARIG